MSGSQDKLDVVLQVLDDGKWHIADDILKYLDVSLRTLRVYIERLNDEDNNLSVRRRPWLLDTRRYEYRLERAE
jgi:hypothetical protein